MYEWFISFRYLRARHKQRFISLISLISVAGITVGVMALIVVLAVYSGFTNGLRDQILGINSHIIVQLPGGSIRDYESVRKQILTVAGVTGATPYLYTQTLMSGASGGSGQGALLAKLDQLISVASAIPAGVGDQVGGAIGSAAKAASFRTRYPAGGA